MRDHNSNPRRGAAMVEATLILPLFLVFWFGIVDWGVTFWTHQSLVYQANEAARWAVVHGYNADAIKNMVVYGNPAPSDGAKPQFGLSTADVAVNLICAPGATCNTAASDLSNSRRIIIQISNYNVTHFTPFFAGAYTGRTIVVSLPTENLSDTIATGA
jgi:Flp pilus assembly protein TadG